MAVTSDGSKGGPVTHRQGGMKGLQPGPSAQCKRLQQHRQGAAAAAHQLAQGEAAVVGEVGVAGFNAQGGAEVRLGCSGVAQPVERDAAFQDLGFRVAGDWRDLHLQHQSSCCPLGIRGRSATCPFAPKGTMRNKSHKRKPKAETPSLSSTMPRL